MAGNTWEKRQREKAKRERKEAKRAKRDEKRGTETEETRSNEDLMAEFTALNREHAAGTIDEETFKLRRNEIWLALGLPPD